MTNPEASSEQWRFFCAGGFDQVKLDTGSDLMALDQLDLKLWVALACPTTGLEFDKATLALIDTDKGWPRPRAGIDRGGQMGRRSAQEPGRLAQRRPSAAPDRN